MAASWSKGLAASAGLLRPTSVLGPGAAGAHARSVSPLGVAGMATHWWACPPSPSQRAAWRPLSKGCGAPITMGTAFSLPMALWPRLTCARAYKGGVRLLAALTSVRTLSRASCRAGVAVRIHGALGSMPGYSVPAQHGCWRSPAATCATSPRLSHLLQQDGEVGLGGDGSAQLGHEVVVVGVEELGHVQRLRAGHAARHGKVQVIARKRLRACSAEGLVPSGVRQSWQLEQGCMNR